MNYYILYKNLANNYISKQIHISPISISGQNKVEKYKKVDRLISEKKIGLFLDGKM